MARNENLDLSPNSMTQLTNADASKITIQNASDNFVSIYANSSATNPDATDGHIILPPRGLLVNESISDLFPGISGADRVFAMAAHGARLFVSHA